MILRLFPCLFLLLIAAATPADAQEAKIPVGWVEKIRVKPIAPPFKAKLDTGAKTSSLGVEIVNIEEKEVERPSKTATTPGGAPVMHMAKIGKVTFMLEDAEGNKRTYERHIRRWVRIKRKGKAGFIRRPVVHMRFCIAGREIEDEVNLAVRQRFIYPVLIGRNMLEKGHLLVDASRTFLHSTPCPAAP